MNSKAHVFKKFLHLIILLVGVALSDVSSANAQVAFGIKGGLSINSSYRRLAIWLVLFLLMLEL